MAQSLQTRGDRAPRRRGHLPAGCAIRLEQFFRIIPDRKPVTGGLSQRPDAPTASAFRPAAQAVDYLRGLNTLAIVIELPASQLTGASSKKIGVWGTINR